MRNIKERLEKATSDVSAKDPVTVLRDFKGVKWRATVTERPNEPVHLSLKCT